MIKGRHNHIYKPMSPEEQKTRVIKIIVAIIVILGVAAFFAFSPSSSRKTESLSGENTTSGENAVTTPRSPQEFIPSFIDWYMGNKNLEVMKNAKTVADEAFKKEYITEEFKIGLPNKVSALFKEGIDVITCTKVKPISFSVKTVIPTVEKTEKFDPEKISYDVETSLPGHKILMTLAQNNKMWKVQSINCPTVVEGK